MTDELRNAAILLRRGSWVDPELFERAAGEIERLTARVAELEKDAKRYRGLCGKLMFDRGLHQSSPKDWRVTIRSWWHLETDSLFITESENRPDSVDAAIDAAIAAEAKG